MVISLDVTAEKHSLRDIMSEIAQITPWYDAKEWTDVYDNMYAETATLGTKKKALNQLMIWKARCPSLPSGVESSVSLLYVHIQDQENCDEFSNEHILRLAYSSALMRFINHMFDKDTAKGLSLYQVAKTLGVPEWIIEMRHDTAHSNRLPPLELFREASIISLKWLQKNYWDKHKQYISDFVVGKPHNQTEIENRLTALINFCVSLSICSHPKCNIKNLAEIKDANIRECVVSDAKELLEDGLDMSNLKMISIGILKQALDSKAKKVLYNDFHATFINKALLSEDSVFMSQELYEQLDIFGSRSNRHLSKTYMQCFDGLLSFLFTYDLLRDFVLDLVKVTQCENENVKKRKLAAKWVSAILKALSKNQQFLEKINKTDIDIMSKDKKTLKNLYYHWYPNDKNRTLLLDLDKPVPKEFTNINFIQPIISTFNPYLIYFVGNLLYLVRPKLPQPVILKICKLAEVIASAEKFPVVTTKIYTVEDLEEVKKLEDIPQSHHDEDMEVIEVQEDKKIHNHDGESKQRIGIWKASSKTHKWSTCPIGQLPWTHLSTPSMETE